MVFDRISMTQNKVQVKPISKILKCQISQLTTSGLQTTNDDINSKCFLLILSTKFQQNKRVSSVTNLAESDLLRCFYSDFIPDKWLSMSLFWIILCHIDTTISSPRRKGNIHRRTLIRGHKSACLQVFHRNLCPRHSRAISQSRSSIDRKLTHISWDTCSLTNMTTPKAVTHTVEQTSPLRNDNFHLPTETREHQNSTVTLDISGS